MVITALSGTTTTIMKVSNIRTISAAMNKSEINKGMFQMVDKLK